MDGNEARPTTLAEKVNYLFDKIRHPSGREYHNTELAAFVEQETGSSCTRSYVSRIRNEKSVDGLTHAKIDAIAKFFNVSPALLFNNDANAKHILDQVALYAELLDGDLRIEALREVVEFVDRADAGSVLELIKQLKTRRQDATEHSVDSDASTDDDRD